MRDSSRWALLLLLLLPALVASQVDTKDGTAITSSTTLDGETGIDTADGQAITAGGGGGLTCGGTTVISDNFDDDDITDWTTSGTISASGGVVGWSLASAPHTAYKNTTGYEELWAVYTQAWTWTVWNTGLANVSRGLGAQYWNGESILGVGVEDVSGVEKFRIDFREVSAQQTNTAYTVATGVTYTITLYVLQATTTSSNDGILRVWVDGGAFTDQLIYEDVAVDNSEEIMDRFTFGTHYTDGQTGSAAFDDLLICTTEPT